jgi:hypothetical protein
MRTTLTTASVLLIMLTSCTKSSVDNPNYYAGNFKGNIEMTANGVFSRTIVEHTINITPTNNKNEYDIYNNIVALSSAVIKANTITLEKTLVGTSPGMNLYVYGKGTYTGKTLSIEFHQDTEDPNTHAIKRSEEYKGVLTRQ